MKKEKITSIVTFSIASFVDDIFLTYTLTSTYTSQLKRDSDKRNTLLMLQNVSLKNEIAKLKKQSSIITTSCTGD